MSQAPPFFNATATFACKTNRLYRIYVGPNETICVWAGHGMDLVNGIRVGGAANGLLGVLLTYWIANALDPTKSNQARATVIDNSPFDTLIGDHPNNLRASNFDFDSVRFYPPTVWQRMNDGQSQAMILMMDVRHHAIGKLRFAIPTVQDAQAALTLLPPVLRDRCKIDAEWNEKDQKYVKKKV